MVTGPWFPELEGLTLEQRVARLQKDAADDYQRHQAKIAERNEIRGSLRGKDN